MPLIFDVLQAIRNDNAEELDRLLQLPNFDHHASFKGTRPLSLAIYLNHLRCFTLLLHSGASLNKRSMDHLSRSETPIISSIRLGRNEIFFKLLHSGAKLNLTDFYNQAPLWFAVKEQRVSFVKLLLSMGAPITFNDARESPLSLVVQFLCYRVRRELAVELVDAGLQINLVDMDNRTPLLWALYHSDFSFFYLLIEAGAPVPSTVKNKKHKIPHKWKQDPQIETWITHELSTPVPLLRQCRTKVRTHLRIKYNKDIRPMIDRIPLPKVLKDYLLLTDALSLTDFCSSSSSSSASTRDYQNFASPLNQLVTTTSFVDPFALFNKIVS